MIFDIDTLLPICVPIPHTLKELISSPESSIKDVLREDIVFRLFRTNEPQLINYFVIHVDELLQLSFDDGDTEVSAKAYAILEHAQPTLTQALLYNQHFHNAAIAVLAQPNPSILHLDRLSSLTLSAIYICPEVAPKSCGFILQLISYLYQYSVLELFEHLCTYSKETELTQTTLEKMGFPQMLYKELENFPKITKDTNQKSQDASQLYGLFRVLTICGSSPILGPHVCTYNFVSIVNRDVDEFPKFVEYQRWEAISALYCPATAEIMRGLYPNVIEMLNNNEEVGSRSYVAAIDLLTVIVQFDVELVPYIISSNAVERIVDLLFTHPNHNIMQFSIRDFLFACLDNKELHDDTAQKIMKMGMRGIHINNVSVRANVYRIIKHFMKRTKSDQKLYSTVKNNEEFMLFLMNNFQIYKALWKRHYGGVLYSPAADDIQDLVRKTMATIGC